MKTKLGFAGKCLCFGALTVLCGSMAQATTINISTGAVTYTITSDTNGSPDPTAPPNQNAVDTTVPTTGLYAHVADVTNGINTGVWIGPTSDQTSESGSVSGTTVYQVTFNLTGLDYTTADLYLTLAGDDLVSLVTLNGNTIFTHSGSEMWSSGTTVPTVTTDFVAGVNTLDFTVPNYSNDGAFSCCGPTGLAAAADVTANAVTTPEPGTLGITGLTLIGLAALLRRRLA